jgi:putative membrane protein
MIALVRAWPIVLISAARASWAPLVILAIVLLVWRTAVWARTTYGISSEGLVVRSGILWRNIQAVPPQRVQQVEVRRQLRHRATGLAVVRIGLAGGGDAAQVELEALSLDEAHELAATLERWRARHRPAATSTAAAPAEGGAADPSLPPPPQALPPPPRPPLLQLTTGQLVIAGLTSRSLWLAPFAALAAFVQFMGDSRFAIDTTDDVRAALAEASPALTLVAIMIIGLGMAAVGTVFSHYGLVIHDVDDDLVVRRGLFDQRTVTIPRDRVQFVELSAHVLRRRLHLASFDVRTADLGGGGGSGGSSTSIPIGPRDSLERLVPELVRDVEFPETRRHPPAAVRRSVIRRCLRLVPAAGFVGWAVAGLGAVPLAAGIGFAVAVPAGWMAGRRLRSGWTSSAIVTERGVVGWRRSVVPVRRVQSIGIAQNPFQRRLGLATVRLDVAGSVGGIELRDLAAADAVSVSELVGTPLAVP